MKKFKKMNINDLNEGYEKLILQFTEDLLATAKAFYMLYHKKCSNQEFFNVMFSGAINFYERHIKNLLLHMSNEDDVKYIIECIKESTNSILQKTKLEWDKKMK